MKKLSLLVTIYIVLSLLFVIGNFTAVMAAPDRILEPSFETVANWAYSETDGDYNGAQSGAWAQKQGANSYLLSCTNAGIGGSKYAQIAQSSVNFTLLDRIFFDTQLYSNQTTFEAQVWVGATKVWSKAVPTATTNYLKESVDVSTYTGSLNLIIRVDNIGGTISSGATMTAYFDNIKIWGSYSDENTWLNVCNTFTGAANYIYMYGENFDAGDYIVRYWDASAAQVGTDANITVLGDGILTSSLACNTDTGATAGLWTARVHLLDETLIAEDTFTVNQDAIPEFSTVFAGIGVAGLCFGIYWWMRRRAQGVCRVHGVES